MSYKTNTNPPHPTRPLWHQARTWWHQAGVCPQSGGLVHGTDWRPRSVCLRVFVRVSYPKAVPICNSIGQRRPHERVRI